MISLSKCLYKKYLNKKINYKILKSKSTFFSIFHLKNYIKDQIIKNESYKNIIISNQNFANVITMISLNKLTKIKKVLIERNHLNELKYFRNFKDFIKKQVILIFIKIFYSKSDAVVGISKQLSNDLSKFINKKVITIYNPSFEEKIIKNNKAIKTKIDTKKKIILNVGYLEKQKDQITILKSINILKRYYQNFLLILVGNGNEYSNLKKYIKKNFLIKYVKIYKNVKNPTFFYKKADLFILSSIYEGLGNVLVEALKYKCPVITSSCNSGPMEIILNGKYGDFFEPGDYKDLSKKILNHLSRPEKLRKKLMIPKSHFDKFSLKKNIYEFNQLFSKI